MRRLERILPVVAGLLLLSLLASSRIAVAASESTCVNGGRQNPEIASWTTALQQSPARLGRRMVLANLLERAGCYDEAVHLLEEGKRYNSSSAAWLHSLQRARDMADAARRVEDIGQAEASARLNRKMERCTRERDVAACDEVLSQQPNNTKIPIARGDALQSQRQASLKRCTDGDGDAALQACKLVLVRGAPDEFEITVRMALLQQSTNQASQALDSYIAANSLRHGDKGVALAILALLQSTERKDAIALAARGSALVTLGRAHEALVPLRQAKALEPALPDIDQQIKTAEALARQSQVAAANPEAEAMVEPPKFSNLAEATRSN